ncbi:MAG: response regulator, partial [Elusimicrobia bacterium]|nr:response regulator [Elusimicrobiota bacterium]
MSSAHGRPKRTRRILIVDDDESFLDYCVHALKLSGFEVSWAEDGRKAESLLSARPFDIVLTDNLRAGPLPMARLAKQLQPDVEVIMMTARGRGDAAAPAPGVRACLAKPFREEQL